MDLFYIVSIFVMLSIATDYCRHIPSNLFFGSFILTVETLVMTTEAFCFIK